MVDCSMFEYYRDTWPAKELARQEYGAAQTMRTAFREAEDILDEFRQFQTEVMGDPKLSAVGKKELRDAWLARKMPTLTQRIEKIREEVAKAEEAVTRQAMEKLAATKADYDPETRHWLLREHPTEIDRGDAIRRQLAKGDLSGVRAVLTVPSFLAGIEDEGTVAEFREDVIKQLEPERFERMAAIRRGGGITVMALTAATNAIDDVARQPLTSGSEPTAGPAPRPVPLDPETQRRIAEATEAALARQEQIRAAEAAQAA